VPRAADGHRQRAGGRGGAEGDDLRFEYAAEELQRTDSADEREQPAQRDDRMDEAAGIDRILDMARTTVNVTGDAAVSVLVAQGEGELDLDIFNERPE
jgi:hypothetical protein